MFTKGHAGWNKGLTKETDARVRLNAKGIALARKGCIFTEEHKASLSLAKLGTHPTEEARTRLSITMKTIWEDPTYRQKQVESRREIIIPREVLEDLYLVKRYTISRIARELGYAYKTVRQHFTEYNILLKPHGWAVIGRRQTVEEKKKQSLALKGQKFQRRKPQEEINKMCIDRQKRLWKNPDYIIMQLKARGARPNKPEQYLESILKNHFPEYKYNGDGRLGIVLAGLVPDFVNVNGKKQVIEVFGDYFHSPKVNRKWHHTELGRIMALNSVGWDCLVLWEHELKELTEVEIVKKINDFSEKRRLKCLV